MKRMIKIFNTEYNPKSKLHNFIFLLAVAALIFSLFTVRENPSVYIATEKDAYVWQSPHVKQFDAFLKGQLYLDAEPSKELLELENPYDTAARDASGAYYLWDYAFYGGKYYSYFGVAPLITAYLPVYIATGGVPSDAYTTLVLAIYAVIFAALAFRELIIRFVKKANLWLFIFGMGSFIAVSGVYTSVLIADMYYVPVVSALGAVMAFAFYAIRSARKTGKERKLLLTLAACSLALAVLSRPSSALICFAFLPFIAEKIFKSKKSEWKKELSELAFFAVPLALLAAAVMWYNAARFSSPFDFGVNYQLTVSDISKNTIEKGFVFSALFSYFLYPFWEYPSYPYIIMQWHILLPPDARYVYCDLHVGAFALVLPAAVMLYSRIMRKDREVGERDFSVSALVVLASALSLTVAFLDFCKGGVNMRYVYDIVPVLALLGTAALLKLFAQSKGFGKSAALALCLAAFVAAIWANTGVIEHFRYII